ncbi:MAG: DUF3857 domain-containing protein [Bacteroidetes bacterium]|nr:DUF3857 domain-containing protein [Bacteroidota bacterium]
MSKKIFSIILVFSVCIKLSSQTQLEIRDAIWANADNEFKVMQIPEKWNKESAVVIALKTSYTADFVTRMVGLSTVRYINEISTFHKRIKLLDAAAIKEYSELSFNSLKMNSNMFGKAKEYRTIGIKVIKPNGTEHIVDLNESVKTESTSSKENKIAVPNLEINDIIDFFITTKEDNYNVSLGQQTDVLAEEYPVMSYKVVVKVPKEYLLDYIALNGAPVFTEERIEKDITYTLVAKDIEKRKKLLWTYPVRTFPVIKYKINTNGKKDDSPHGFHLNETDLGNYLNNISLSYIDVGIIWDYFNKNMKKETSQKKIVNEAIYLLRNPLYQNLYFSNLSKNPLENDNLSNDYFAILAKILTKYKIKYHVLAAPYRKAGTLSEINSFSNLDLYFKIMPSDGDPIFVARMEPFLLPNKVGDDLDGQEALISKGSSKLELTSTEISPNSTSNDNRTESVLKVSFNEEDNSKLNVQRRITARGYNKTFHQYEIVTPYDYYVEYTQPKYEVSDSRLFNKVLKEYQEEKAKYEQRKSQDYNQREEKIKKSIEDDGDMVVSGYKDFKLISPGMWIENPFCEYSDAFVVENICKKAGNNYLLELPKLIEQQTEFDEEEEKNRTQDVYMDYARSYLYIIEFEIPEGYTVEGYEALNKKYDTPFGGFESTVKIEGNKLIISTKKHYDVNYIKASDWPQCKEFMNGAVNFTKQKILLKKK